MTLQWVDGGGGDALAENLHNLSLSTFCFTANNPINNIDPDGKDWYKNSETGNYTWYKGKAEREGYEYIGGKNSALGEFESKINTILIKTFGVKGGLYSEGFTFDVVDKEKGGLTSVKNKNGKIEGNFLDEFINGTGPEFSVFMGDHPYTKEMKTEKIVEKSQKLIASGKTDVKGQITGVGSGFGLWGALTSFSMAEQFIGSYRLDIFTSQNGKDHLNIISDSKSKSSLYLNLPVTDKRRNETQSGSLGTTYQFYIWKSPLKNQYLLLSFYFRFFCWNLVIILTRNKQENLILSGVLKTGTEWIQVLEIKN